MYGYRPTMAMPKTTLQKIANVFGYGLFIGCTVYSLLNLSGLPSQVPTHFNFAGEADGWGSKYSILLLPVITIVIVFAIEALEKRPHLHNYPESMNETNVEQYYAVSIRTLNLIKNALLATFGFSQIEMVHVAQQLKFIFGNMLFASYIVVIIAPVVWQIFSIRRIKKHID